MARSGCNGETGSKIVCGGMVESVIMADVCKSKELWVFVYAYGSGSARDETERKGF